MNFTVIIHNGGKMPVLSQVQYVQERHFSYQESSEIEYPILSDYIPFQDRIYSIGDIVMFVGLWGMLSVYFVYWFVIGVRK